MIVFKWDETKNKKNRAKHGVWFEEAQTAFDDSQARIFVDDDHSHDEERYILIGTSSAARLLLIVHCYRESDTVVRIISARRPTKKEVRFYEEGI